MKNRVIIISSFAESLLNFRGDLIDAFQSQGFIVHVVAPDFDNSSNILMEFKSRGISAHKISMDRVGLNPYRDFLTAWSLYLLMCKIRPQFILAYTAKPVIYGVISAWLAKVPFRYALITGVGYSFSAGKSKIHLALRALVRLMYKFALHKASLVFFQNPDDKALFSSLEIVNTFSKYKVINGSGVNLDKFPLTKLPEAVHFLMVSRLLVDKGVREYIAAATKMKKHHPEIIFSIAGWIDGGPNSIGQQELDGWVSEGNVNFLGFLEDVRPAISRAGIFVLPSYREGTPRSVLEAMSMGRAIITTDAPGCRETVVDGGNGFLVPVQSVDAIYDAMLKFVVQPALISKMGSVSRSIAEIKFDVKLVNKSILKGMNIDA